MASPIANTLEVWRGLFLREALDRFFGSRAAWAWLIIEPLIHVSLFSVYFVAMRRVPTINNAPMLQWLIIGMLVFFLFRRSAVQAQHSADCNKAFFAFRQVKPFDAAIVRGGLEAFSMAIIATLVAAIAATLGYDMLPANPFLVLGSCAALWFLAMGYGMICCVIMRLIPESGHIMNLFFMPLYILSGVILPI